MPRQYNFVRSHAYNPVGLANKRVGFGEIEPLQRRIEEGKFLQWRHHQFSATPVKGVPLTTFQQTMNEAFRWLEDNMKAPWHWKEEEINNGHSIAVKVHIERISDQKRFKDKYCPFFAYEADTEAHLAHLAVINNVLPLKKSLTQWTAEHGLTLKFGTKAGCAEVEADTPEKAKKFMEEWGAQFNPVLTNGHMPKRFKKACFAADVLRGNPVVIPDDFRDYLHGKCDFSAVRTLPKPNGILLKAEMACK